MTTQTLSPTPILRFVDNNGAPLSGGKLYTYAAGTSTPAATYTDSTGSTPNSNPIVLNARGECSLWIPPNVAYKYVLQDSTGNQIPGWPVDNIVNAQLLTLYGGVDTGAINAYVLNFTATFTSYVDGIAIYWIPSHTNTGPSTMNVNGLGAINIVNQDGTPMGANQIQSNQVLFILCKGGQFILSGALGSGGIQSVAGVNVTGATVPSNGISLPSANTLGLAANGVNRVTVSSTALTSSVPALITGNSKVTGTLEVTGTLTADTGITVAAGGATVTGNSKVTGTLETTGALTVDAGGLTVTTGGANITGGLTIDGATIYAQVYKVKTSATNHATLPPTNDPDLTVNLVAGTYIFDFFINWFSSTGAVTPSVGVNYSGTFTAANSSIGYLWYAAGGTTVLGANVQSSPGTVVWVTPAAGLSTTQPTLQMISGTLVATGSGTLALSFGAAAPGAQTQPGSYIRLFRVA